MFRIEGKTAKVKPFWKIRKTVEEKEEKVKKRLKNKKIK